MIYRIIFYIIGLILSSIGFALITIYSSYNNVGYSLIENIGLMLTNHYTYLFLIGATISLISLFYDYIKPKNK